MKLPSLFGSLLLAVAAALPAQSPRLTPWPGSTFTNAILGEFAGDLPPCVFVVRNGELWYLFDPSRFSDRWQMYDDGQPITGVTGMAKYRSAPGGTPLDRDTLVFTNANGLHLATMVDTATGQELGVQHLQAGNWCNARNLAVHLTGYGSLRIAAVTSDGHNVVTGIKPAAGTLGPPTLDHSTAEVRNLAYFDWNHDGPVDLVVTTTAGIGTSFDQGELVLSVPHNLYAGNAFPVTENFDADLGVLTNQLVFPQYSLAWTDSSGALLAQKDIPAGILSAVQQIPTAVGVHDIEDDGDSDFVLTRRGEFTFWVAHASLGVERVDIMESGNGAQLNTCPLLWGDFFDGPLPDLIAFLNTGTLPNGPSGPGILRVSSMIPDVEGWPGHGEELQASTIVTCANLPEEPDETKPQMLNLRVDAGHAATGRTVRMTVWHQANPYGDPVPPVDTVAEVYNFPFGTASEAGQDMTLVLTPANMTDQDHYFVDLRVLTASNSLVHEEMFGFCFAPLGASENPSDAAGTWLAYLMSLSTSTVDDIRIVKHMLQTCSIGFGGLPIGGIIPSVDPPPLPGLPKPKPAEED
ncbi:MAG: hypothetical protein AB7O97_02525 [Planctomycetota bacterium]